MKILLATDAQPASDGAIRVADALARELGAAVEVVRVVEPIPTLGDGAMLAGLPFDPSEELKTREAIAAAELDEKLATFGPTVAGWPRRVEMGTTPYTVVQAAERQGASLIVLGIGRHELADRWLGTETALRVVQLSHIPVLAVPPEGGALPRAIVAAVDFSDFARRAIESALAICQPGTRFHLVHVTWLSPGENPNFERGEAHARLRDELRRQLEGWASSIDGLGTMQVETHVSAGSIPDEVLALAEMVNADLIAAGSHGRGFVGRAVFGSASKALLRRTERAILVAPPPERAEELRVLEFRSSEIRGV